MTLRRHDEGRLAEPLMQLEKNLEGLRAKEPWAWDRPIKWLPNPFLAGLPARAMAEQHVGLIVREP